MCLHVLGPIIVGAPPTTPAFSVCVVLCIVNFTFNLEYVLGDSFSQQIL